MRRLVDVSELQHARQHVLLPRLGTLRIDVGVVGTRRHGQAGERRHFRDGQVPGLLPEVDLRRGREAVGALPEEYLVGVDLEDPVFRQRRLDLVRERDLVDLAHVAAFRAEEEVPRHLHRDRAAALAAAAGHEVRHRRAQQPRVVDAAVLVKAVVLRSQDGLLQGLRDFAEGQEVAPLLAEFADQHAIGRPDAQRNLRPVVRQGVDRRQVRIDDREDEQQQQRRARRAAGDQQRDRTGQRAGTRGAHSAPAGDVDDPDRERTRRRGCGRGNWTCERPLFCVSLHGESWIMSLKALRNAVRPRCGVWMQLGWDRSLFIPQRGHG